MSFEDEYEDIQKRSWVEPLEQVNNKIMVDRKVHVTTHSQESHKYHMNKWKHCVYCDNGIPIEDKEGRR
jgi:hypothetical protein